MVNMKLFYKHVWRTTGHSVYTTSATISWSTFLMTAVNVVFIDSVKSGRGSCFILGDNI